MKLKLTHQKQSRARNTEKSKKKKKKNGNANAPAEQAPQTSAAQFMIFFLFVINKIENLYSVYLNKQEDNFIFDKI